jgi:CNT family concentrative nucleoside transporter
VPTTIVTTPWCRSLHYIQRCISSISTKHIRSIVYALLVTLVIAATVFSFPEKPESPRLKRLISFFGLFVFIIGSFLASVVSKENKKKLLKLTRLKKHKRHVPWNTITTAILLQFLLAIFVFRTNVGHDLFQWIANFAESYLHNAYYGAEFVFGTAAVNANTFALNVFPAIIFFASTVQMLYYLGTIQWVLKKLASVFIAILGVSGAEAIVAVASVSFF